MTWCAFVVQVLAKMVTQERIARSQSEAEEASSSSPRGEGAHVQAEQEAPSTSEQVT